MTKTAPDLTFRQSTFPYSTIAQLVYSQTNGDGNVYPVREGEFSDANIFRIYNNFALNSNIANAENIKITTYDGVGVGSQTTTKSVVSQQWMRLFEQFIGESTPTVSYTFSTYIGTDTAVGGTSKYAIEVGSAGTVASEIRAGTNNAGYGFVEFNSKLEAPPNTGMGSYTFAISLTYDYVV